MADTAGGARELYADGADYVVIAPVLTAHHLHEILRPGTVDAIKDARQRQERQLGRLPPAGQHT